MEKIPLLNAQQKHGKDTFVKQTKTKLGIVQVEATFNENKPSWCSTSASQKSRNRFLRSYIKLILMYPWSRVQIFFKTRISSPGYRYPLLTHPNTKITVTHVGSERSWPRRNGRGWQFPFTSTVLGSFCSEGKFEDICHSLILPGSNVYNSARVLKSDMSGWKG